MTEESLNQIGDSFQSFHSSFADCFGRSESRRHCNELVDVIRALETADGLYARVDPSRPTAAPESGAGKLIIAVLRVLDKRETELLQVRGADRLLRRNETSSPDPSAESKDTAIPLCRLNCPANAKVGT